MWKQLDDRWAIRGVWMLILIGIADRAYLLVTFGFRYIGIDDALIQQVATDYGHLVFREPFLYGQNYNPMLEALLAAPFVRLGGAPWIVLPLVTSLFALLPFWSLAIWCVKRRSWAAALVFAVLPLLLPVEWGMITSMSRGWVHGIALLAAVPWLQNIGSSWLKHVSTALVLVLALFCNMNALPLVAGMAVMLMHRHARNPLFWISGLVALGLGILAHAKAQDFYAIHHPIHPLLAADMQFDPALWMNAISSLRIHLLHMHPFGGLVAFVPIFLLLACVVLWRRKDRWLALGIFLSALVMCLALGVVKVNEGCDSVFFPQSRMFLSLPILLGIAAALVVRVNTVPRWVVAVLVPLAMVFVMVKATRTNHLIGREMAHQGCAWVREERLDDVRSRCETLSQAAKDFAVDVIVPIRWPGIKVDHKAHFQAHFACYACEQFKPGCPPIYGAGYDRRYWIRDRYDDNTHPGRVLFVGGDPSAWNTVGSDLDVSIDDNEMHWVRLEGITIREFLLRSEVDDELDR